MRTRHSIRRKLKSMFFPAKHPSIAANIRMNDPIEYKYGLRRLEMGGISMKEMRAVRLSINRAKAQLHRENLSDYERSQFMDIVNIGNEWVAGMEKRQRKKFGCTDVELAREGREATCPRP